MRLGASVRNYGKYSIPYSDADTLYITNRAGGGLQADHSFI